MYVPGIFFETFNVQFGKFIYELSVYHACVCTFVLASIRREVSITWLRLPTHWNARKKNRRWNAKSLSRMSTIKTCCMCFVLNLFALLLEIWAIELALWQFGSTINFICSIFIFYVAFAPNNNNNNEKSKNQQMHSIRIYTDGVLCMVSLSSKLFLLHLCIIFTCESIPAIFVHLVVLLHSFLILIYYLLSNGQSTRHGTIGSAKIFLRVHSNSVNNSDVNETYAYRTMLCSIHNWYSAHWDGSEMMTQRLMWD